MTAVFGGSGINLISLSGDGPVILQATLHREFEDESKQDLSMSNSGRKDLLGRL